MKLEKTVLNYRNDLDERLTYLKLVLEYAHFRVLFYGLRNLLSHFHWLLGTMVPKLLESYGTYGLVILDPHGPPS